MLKSLSSSSDDPRHPNRWRPTALPGVRLAAAVGDQHAALFGQTCFSKGDAKCTYGTASFLLMNTGDRPVRSENGLLTTVGYKIGDRPATAMDPAVREKSCRKWRKAVRRTLDWVDDDD